MSGKHTSRVKIKVDGEELLNKTGWAFDPGGIVREADNGDYHVGYTESLKEAEVSGSISHTEKIDLVELGKIDNATIIVETNTNQSYVIRGGWLANPAALNTSEGGASLTFNGPPAERM